MRENAYEKMYSPGLALETKSLVKNEEALSREMSIPAKSARNAWLNTTMPGARYLISNCDVIPWKR